MLRSLFSGVSGLHAHQQMMDVVGNNIANVNTTGFKSSTATFEDLLSQTLAGAGAPTATQGGANPEQVGLGSRIASITTNFAQGALEVTGRSTDVAIQGDGFFVENKGGEQLYTRAGNFDFDANGSLVSPDGGLVQGWMANPATHTVNNTAPVTNITLPPGQLIPPVITTSIRMGNMLSADATIGTTVNTAITAYDTQGVPDNIKFTFTKTATNQWKLDAVDNSNVSIGSATLKFDPTTGNLTSTAPTPFTIKPTTPAANWPTTIAIDFGNAATDPTSLKEFGGQSTATTIKQDGSPAGTLQSFNISASGVVTGVFSNGTSESVGQLSLAQFTNPAGLSKGGDSSYRSTADSGLPQIGIAGTGGRGSLAAGSLEMSNVDLAQEFTNLIIAQRGFQANSKVITTSDQMLQTLLELKP